MIPANLPNQLPAETLNISPEALETANCYLQNPDVNKVAAILDVPTHIIADILERKEVRAYINSIFFSTGFNNRFQVRELMDTLIRKKLQDMDESEVGSSKDITEILALSHKISMELLDKEIALEKLRTSNTPSSQVNVQINEGIGGSKYSSLIEQLIRGNSTSEAIDV